MPLLRAATTVPSETKVYANAPVALNASTIQRLRARRSDCEQAGKKREPQHAAIVSKRKQKSVMMASTTADEGKPLHILLGKRRDRRFSRRPVRRVPNLAQVGLCRWLDGFGQLVHDIDRLVHHTALVPGRR